jgi:1-deoxy-D-xylulose-5-phosphate synthase
MSAEKTDNLLHAINSPADLKKLSPDELDNLAREIRQEIISVVSKNGGHLGGSLGAVELIIALHYVFDSPKDKIVFDVGHQAYAHKLLTGRRESFHTLRKQGGISGFCKPKESEHDAFGAGHTATSISAAIGLADAKDFFKEEGEVIAVIGDGAYASGEAFEARNNLLSSTVARPGRRVIVVLNDNGMSISKSVGGLSEVLGNNNGRRGQDSRPDSHADSHLKIGEAAKSLFKKMHLQKDPDAGEESRGGGTSSHEPWERGPLDLPNAKYLGPIDGHDIKQLLLAFDHIRSTDGHVVLHVKTEKGRGYSFAEEDVDKLHGTGPFDIENGKRYSSGEGPSFTEAFANSLIRIGEKDERVFAITAAMGSGTGVKKFSERFPERTKDVGICEQHAVSYASALAMGGLKPVCAIYSTFLQRGYDQLITDACLQGLNVTFAIDRAGLVGDDGPTHHGPYDIAYLRAIPGITIMAPKDGAELADMLYTATLQKGPVAIRYPRAPCINYEEREPKALEIGKAEILRDGEEIAVLCLGPAVHEALLAAKESGIDASIINMRFAKPLDSELVISLAKQTKKILTIEEGALTGGFGSAVLELLSEAGVEAEVIRIGVPDLFIEQASRDAQLKMVGLDREGIKKKMNELVNRKH